MSPARREPNSEPSPPGVGEHPIGTLVIVIVYALLLLAGWLLLYFFVFLPRGPIGG